MEMERRDKRKRRTRFSFPKKIHSGTQNERFLVMKMITVFIKSVSSWWCRPSFTRVSVRLSVSEVLRFLHLLLNFSVDFLSSHGKGIKEVNPVWMVFRSDIHRLQWEESIPLTGYLEKNKQHVVDYRFFDDGWCDVWISRFEVTGGRLQWSRLSPVRDHPSR